MQLSQSRMHASTARATKPQQQQVLHPQQQRQRRRLRCGSTQAGTQAGTQQLDGAATPAPAAAVDYFATDKRPVILFDGVCNLCNGGVNFMLDVDTAGAYRFAALQSNPGRQLLVRCGRAPDDISSIVLVEQDRCFIKSDAVLRIATRLNVPFPLLAALAYPLPKGLIRDPFYDQVANNRYVLFGKQSSCRVADERFNERFLGA